MAGRGLSPISAPSLAARAGRRAAVPVFHNIIWSGVTELLGERGVWLIPEARANQVLASHVPIKEVRDLLECFLGLWRIRIDRILGV